MVGSTREPHFMIHVSYERKVGCQSRTLINQPGLTRASNWRDNKSSTSICQSMVWRLVIGRLGGEKLVLGKPASDIENHSNSKSTSSSSSLAIITPPPPPPHHHHHHLLFIWRVISLVYPWPRIPGYQIPQSPKIPGKYTQVISG